MRLLPLLLLLPAAAIAQDAPPRPMGNGVPPAVLSGGLPPLPQAPRAIPGRLFISPAGEPFRAPVDAPYPLATWFAGADHNHDGKIDLTEMTWDFDRFFDSLDTDHDGTLRNDEIERYERMVPELHSGGFAGGGTFGGGGGRGKGGGHHRGGGGGGGRGGGMGGGMGGTGGGFGGGGGAGGYHGDDAGAGSGGAQGGGQDEQSSDDTPHAPPAYVPTGSATRYELISIPEPVAAMDTDLSGTVTRLELHRAAARRFAILDVKQRGYLTLADLPEPDAERHINPGRNRR